jgi:hypothetical protein
MKLKASTISIDKLTKVERTQLLELFVKYYDNVTPDNFYLDLDKKDRIILLRDKHTKKIKGFSTIKKIHVETGGRDIYALFSGDTIIDSDYWGQAALGVEFVKNLMRIKLNHPTHEVYWFLISKGFKTYLLLAKNFKNFYPRYNIVTPPEMRALIEKLAMQIYPEHFDRQTQIIKVGGVLYKLKKQIAPIGERERQIPDINFFDQMNPNWQQGDELCCIGHFDLGFFTKYIVRTGRKVTRKMRRRNNQEVKIP